MTICGASERANYMAPREGQRGLANANDVSAMSFMAGVSAYGEYTAVRTDESLVQDGEALKITDIPMSGLWLLCVIGTRYANQIYRRLIRKFGVSR